MKKSALVLLCALTGCVVVNTHEQHPDVIEPLPPKMPKMTAVYKHRKVNPSASPKAMTVSMATKAPVRALGAGAPPPPVIPSWTFTTNGNFQILASTNLTTWWPVANVYAVTNVTITSDTVNKRPMLFYRLTAIP